MPLLTVRCPSGHEQDYLHPKEPRPSLCACGEPFADALTAPSRVGPAGGREGTHVSSRPKGDLVHEGGTFDAYQIGASLAAVTTKWGCPAGHWHIDVSEERPATPPACETCGAATKEMFIAPIKDWFAEKLGDAGRYFDHGLGEWIHSKEQRRRLMDERGLVCVADVETGQGEDMHAKWERREADIAREQDETVRRMFAEDWQDADTRRKLDDGRTEKEYDPRRWMKALGLPTE